MITDRMLSTRKKDCSRRILFVGLVFLAGEMIKYVDNFSLTKYTQSVNTYKLASYNVIIRQQVF